MNNSDPRLKTLSQAKYKEFRNWFDQRLDDAIQAAEHNESISSNIQGNKKQGIPEYILSQFLYIIWKVKDQNIIFNYLNSILLCIKIFHLHQMKYLVDFICSFHLFFLRRSPESFAENREIVLWYDAFKFLLQYFLFIPYFQR